MERLVTHNINHASLCHMTSMGDRWGQGDRWGDRGTGRWTGGQVGETGGQVGGQGDR